MKKVFSLLALVFVLSSFSAVVIDVVINCTSYAQQATKGEQDAYGPFESSQALVAAYNGYLADCNFSGGNIELPVFIDNQQ